MGQESLPNNERVTLRPRIVEEIPVGRQEAVKLWTRAFYLVQGRKDLSDSQVSDSLREDLKRHPEISEEFVREIVELEESRARNIMGAENYAVLVSRVAGIFRSSGLMGEQLDVENKKA